MTAAEVEPSLHAIVWLPYAPDTDTDTVPSEPALQLTSVAVAVIDNVQGIIIVKSVPDTQAELLLSSDWHEDITCQL